MFGFEGMYGTTFLGMTLTPFVLGILVLWEAIWKGVGLWKSGRNNQVWWFIAVFIFNTVGILPILYLAFFQKKTKKVVKKAVKKKVKSRKRK